MGLGGRRVHEIDAPSHPPGTSDARRLGDTRHGLATDEMLTAMNILELYVEVLITALACSVLTRWARLADVPRQGCRSLW